MEKFIDKYYKKIVFYGLIEASHNIIVVLIKYNYEREIFSFVGFLIIACCIYSLYSTIYAYHFITMENVKEIFKYRLRYRPLDVGCQPEGFISYEELSKKQTGFFGELTYTRKLTQDEIRKYELFPV